jgi:hypothetical protein
LDELPQLLNVLRGEMTLLGARPEAPEFVDLGDLRWRRVLVAPPGMAGPAQLVLADWEREAITSAPSGDRYVHEVVPFKLGVDRWYVENASAPVDAVILLALLARLAGRRDAHALVGLLNRRRVPLPFTGSSEPGRCAPPDGSVPGARRSGVSGGRDVHVDGTHRNRRRTGSHLSVTSTSEAAER